MWLVAAVGHCVVGCEHCEGYCSTTYQGHVGGWEGLMAIWSSGLGSPGFCSEMSLPDLWNACIKNCSYGVNSEGFLRGFRRVIVFSMGPYSCFSLWGRIHADCWGYILNNQHVETEVDNKHLIVTSCWFSLSSHFAHDAWSQEPKERREKLHDKIKA